MTTTAHKVSFTIDRTALRGLAELASKEKDCPRYPGMSCVRIWGKGSKIFACATQGIVAGIWHQDNPESLHDFAIYLPVPIVKAIVKIGKKWTDLLIEIDGEIVKASAGGKSVSHIVPRKTLYESLFPYDGLLDAFRPKGELSREIQSIAYNTIGLFHVLSDAWGHPGMTSQGMSSKLPIFLHFPAQPNFVGALMPLTNDSDQSVYESPGWLNDLLS